MYYGYDPYWNNSSITVMWSGLYFLTGRTITRVSSCGPLLPRQTGPVVWLPPPPPGALTWVTEECGPGETVGVGRLTFPRTRSQDSRWVTALRLGQDQVYDAGEMSLRTAESWAFTSCELMVLSLCHYCWGTKCELPAELKLEGHIGASVLLWRLLHPSRYESD